MTRYREKGLTAKEVNEVIKRLSHLKKYEKSNSSNAIDDLNYGLHKGASKGYEISIDVIRSKGR